MEKCVVVRRSLELLNNMNGKNYSTEYGSFGQSFTSATELSCSIVFLIGSSWVFYASGYGKLSILLFTDFLYFDLTRGICKLCSVYEN